YNFPPTAVSKPEAAVIPPDTAVPPLVHPSTSQPTPSPDQMQPTPATPAVADTPVHTSRKRFAGIAAGILLIALLIGGFFLRPRLFPSIPSSAGMVKIPAGSYTVGQGNGGNQYAAEQQVALVDYWIDQYEVSNGAYAAFVDDTNAELPPGWSGSSGPVGQEQNPVRGVSWEMARAYCNWADKRLPTEAEWEVAARGPDGLLYPWGDDRELVNLPANEPYASGTIPVNRSAFNVYDMAGNVWEWVDEPYTAVPAGQQVLRGGAYDNQRDLAYRLAGDPTIPTMRVTAGFRCAASEVEIVPEADILLQEEFIDPESGWQTKDDGSVLFGYHQPDFYHVQAGDADTLSTSFFGGNFDNITMEALVFVDATDTETGDFRYGLVLRQNGDSYYAFTISPRAGQWYVLKNTTAGLDVLTQGSIDSLQGLTGKDRLRVDAGGSDFAFSINGRLVSQFNDADLPEGDIGFLVQTFDETRAHVHYDTLTVRRVAYAPTTTVLLSDNFTDPNSGWPTVTEGATLSGYHQPDFYHVQSGEPAHRSTAFFERDFDNFTVETEIFVDSTDTPDGDFRYGLAVRRQGNNYYAFLVSPQTGEWRVIKNSDAGEELLAAGNEASAQGVTAVNHLRVDADGPNLIFHANGRPLILVNDDSYSQGDIGFIVETVDQSRAHVHYDTFTVRQVDADLTAAPSTASVAANPTAAPTAAPTPEPTVVPTPEPSIPTAAGMVLVDGGTYDVGENTAVALDPFWIDQVEVTNAQFAAFLEATGQTSSAPAAEDDHPVRGVTWDEAAAYCQWADKRLPTEAEWVAAARGPHAWLYPWGDDETAVILPDSGAYPVGSIPANRSTFGAYDMAGNVWEWCADRYAKDY
ncbi:MAG: SUMF1/EgtB/PvdO family nonheme iron enzyme, partial [Anaerolineae bacterium]